MNNMRRGFTMIELIFVIVIIGILAAVAIPKLSATRDDAKISNIVANSRTAIGDFTARYTSQGQAIMVEDKVSAVTNIPFLTTACAAIVPTTLDVAASTLMLCDGTGTDGVPCITFVVDANVTQVTATIADSATSAVCHGVFDDPAINALASTTGVVHKLGGVGVVR